MKYIFVIARVLLGLVFTVFGLERVSTFPSESNTARSRGTVHRELYQGGSLLRDRIRNGTHRRCAATQQAATCRSHWRFSGR